MATEFQAHSGSVDTIVFVGPTAGVALGAVVTYLWRRRDRQSEARKVVQAFVRDCEGRRVLWWPEAWEEADACYQSVQGLRETLRDTLGALPPNTDLESFESIRAAAETYCGRYEQLSRKLPRLKGWATRQDLEEMLGELRETVVPELEVLRIRFRVS
ncbi:hypothetical protein [Streptomyces sp. NPDC002209]|uniref:hypothetical protein n=1 Tax=Streptomyces sp. NPDC002209 TaxID=3364638 RepID=UPI0036BDD52C